ncbi:hypothetical protein [Streptomyces solicathayae]|uniref:Integral membrane protein n=1 Tax=Streptomyces solicathayae TaxID=3081768 RepID=A0ABZ0LX10_9ACTN|nr:hypothetical protein [Streptomyces sp. HUAS YS2]WOX23338.1 hypothetical protein R2D22_18860 [Streptomyces sp. HUAS YS2]
MSAPTPAARAGAAPRFLRAAVFTAVCVVLSALGHALAACEGIALWTIAAGLVGVFVLILPFAGRERSLPAVVGALAVGQLSLHTLFGVGQILQQRLAVGPEADAALIRVAARLVCGAGAAAALTPADAARIVTAAGIDPARVTAGGVAAPVHHGSGATGGAGAQFGAELVPNLPMLLGHLLAALATGWLLRRGDLALGRLVRLSAEGATGLAEAAFVRALRAALTLVRSLLAGLPGLPATGPRRPARTAGDSSPPPAAEALQHSVIRRGPPAGLCVLAA